ncbi:hypothetical protein GJ496_003102 [Pomphorhynchus laevis]|nr:hypothetical protein GJ496_003102 [Pomphorhynchus laevis]
MTTSKHTDVSVSSEEDIELNGDSSIGSTSLYRLIHPDQMCSNFLFDSSKLKKAIKYALKGRTEFYQFVKGFCTFDANEVRMLDEELSTGTL